MTDIDIERIKRTAAVIAALGDHSDECIYEYPSCAVLALIERLEEAEAQRNALQEQNDALRKGNPIGPVIGAQALLQVTQQRDRLKEENAEMRNAIGTSYAYLWRVTTDRATPCGRLISDARRALGLKLSKPDKAAALAYLNTENKTDE